MIFEGCGFPVRAKPAKAGFVLWSRRLTWYEDRLLRPEGRSPYGNGGAGVLPLYSLMLRMVVANAPPWRQR